MQLRLRGRYTRDDVDTLKISTVLFDLDGTLIESHMHDGFITAYYAALAECVADVLPADELVAQLRAATKAMVVNDGQVTNEQAFCARFYPLRGRSQEEMQPVFDRFYREEFGRLRELTEPVPGARDVVQKAVDLGFRIVLATNPLFPESAIRQRMEWADVHDLPWELVTSYENSRAAKPDLRYFRDIVAHLEVRPEECLMVGDEDWDMVAAKIGCRTFLVPGLATGRTELSVEPNFTGDLKALGAYLEAQAKIPEVFPEPHV